MKGRTLYWAVSIVLAAGLLYWALRGIDWAQVWRTLAHARLAYVAAVCAIISGNMFLRAIRWRVLLSAGGRVAVPDAFWATAAGYLGNSFLPARAGEVVRTMMVAARSGLSPAFILTTALSERMVDAILLVLIGSWALVGLPSKPDWIARAATPLAVAGAAGAVGIALLPYLAPLWERILGRLPVPQKIREKLDHLVKQIVLGVRSFHSVRRLAGFFGLAAIIWLVDGVTAVVAARALDLALPFPIAFLLIAGLGLSSALPSTPGYVGVYQFVAVTVLTPFGFRRDEAIAYILLFQAMQYAAITFWGVGSWVLGVGKRPYLRPE